VDVILFGATGMVGQGALRACLADARIGRVLVIGRTPTGVSHPKLREIIRADLADHADIEADLAGYDACFWCLGVSSFRMDEARYTKTTYDLTLAAATTLSRLNPAMTFVFVSGAGADSSERGRVMWARVKGRTENAVRCLPFKAVYVFRPGAIQPLRGIRSKTASYRLIYRLASPLFTALKWAVPHWVLTTDSLARAMIRVGREGADQTLLEARDIHALSQRS